MKDCKKWFGLSEDWQGNAWYYEIKLENLKDFVVSNKNVQLNPI